MFIFFGFELRVLWVKALKYERLQNATSQKCYQHL